jgi:enoyl-CoA hydratase/carnithine racemase
MKLNNIELVSDKQNIINLIIKSKNILINQEFIQDFQEAINFIANNKNIKGVIISTDHHNYNYNYDLEFLMSLSTSELIFNTIIKLSKNLRKLEKLNIPIVSIISGKVELGGLEIILHSHYKITDNETSTKFHFKNTTYALIPAIGGTQRLPRQIGINKSLNLLLSNSILSSEEALEIQLVDEITNNNQLMNRAKEYISKNKTSSQPWDNKNNINRQPSPFSSGNLGYFISKIAALHSNTSDHYPSVKTLISAVYEGLNTDVDSGIKIEARYFTWLIQHNETRSMIKTLYLYKPEEEFKKTVLNKFKESFDENFAAEGVRLLLNGVSAAMIENAGKRLGFQFSPLETADKLGIQCVINQLDSTDASIASLIRSMQKINRNGLSSNKGFYDYKENKKKYLWHGLTEMIPPSKIQPDIQEVENRLLYSSINNIFYNYLKSSELKNYNIYNFISINNLGLPKWTGGPFEWVTQNGLKNFINKNEKYAKTLGSRFVLNNKIINIIEQI